MRQHHLPQIKVNDEFVAKERDRAVQQRIARSKSITDARNSKMFARDAMLKVREGHRPKSARGFPRVGEAPH